MSDQNENTHVLVDAAVYRDLLSEHVRLRRQIASKEREIVRLWKLINALERNASRHGLYD